MTGLNDIPKGPHWAIIQTVNVTIPSDERSRTNPGHGYPEHTETYLSYRAFTDEATWISEIVKLSSAKYDSPFRAIKVETPDIKISVSVS